MTKVEEEQASAGILSPPCHLAFPQLISLVKIASAAAELPINFVSDSRHTCRNRSGVRGSFDFVKSVRRKLRFGKFIAGTSNRLLSYLLSRIWNIFSINFPFYIIVVYGVTRIKLSIIVFESVIV